MRRVKPSPSSTSECCRLPRTPRDAMASADTPPGRQRRRVRGASAEQATPPKPHHLTPPPEKVVLRLECSECKTKKQLPLKRCKHFELGYVGVAPRQPSPLTRMQWRQEAKGPGPRLLSHGLGKEQGNGGGGGETACGIRLLGLVEGSGKWHGRMAWGSNSRPGDMAGLAARRRHVRLVATMGPCCHGRLSP
jgi:ribosomal protein L44E